MSLTVEVHDAVTAKQVSRDLALSRVPRDSQPLTVALAADELLRASWAELELHTAPPPALPVPPEVTQTVHEALAPPVAASARVQLGVGFVWEQYAQGVILYGADARLGVWWTGSELSGLALLTSLGPRVWTVPLRGVDATDAHARFVGLDGVGCLAQLGVSSAL